MDLQEALERYQGTKLNLNELSQYQQWAFNFFHNEEFVANPQISVTIQLDLEKPREVYERSFQNTPAACFQGYLVWNLVKALSIEWTFGTRKINGEWYLFKNIPVFFPIAVGGENRFKNVIINDVILMDWPTFCRVYRESIENSKNDGGFVSELIWEISYFIGNLPYLNFTSLQIHRGTQKSGRPLFYFGQRHTLYQKQTVPLSVTLDHSNADPYVLNQLMETYQGLLTTV